MLVTRSATGSSSAEPASPGHVDGRRGRLAAETSVTARRSPPPHGRGPARRYHRTVPVRPILTLGDPRLREPGREVVSFDRALGRLIDDMIETMDAAPGVGLAAQQVGVDLRLCVIRVDGQLYELANPTIVHASGEEGAWEGCLSVPGFRAWRVRAEHTVVTGQARDGRRITVSGHGELARAIQHETDHLHGELYLDALPPDQEVLTEEELEERFRSDEAE
jgi:peptide deformylase